MTVTAGGSDNVSEDVAVDCLLDKVASTMKILFHKVKFVPQMPISLDVTVPDIAYSEKNGTVEFSADGIIPLSGGTVPFPKYTVAALSGTLNAHRFVSQSQFRRLSSHLRWCSEKVEWRWTQV